MYIPNRQPRLRSAPARAGFAFAGLLPLLGGQAQAVEFSFLDNEVSGSLDTTLSYGTLWRVSVPELHIFKPPRPPETAENAYCLFFIKKKKKNKR